MLDVSRKILGELKMKCESQVSVGRYDRNKPSDRVEVDIVDKLRPFV